MINILNYYLCSIINNVKTFINNLVIFCWAPIYPKHLTHHTSHPHNSEKRKTYYPHIQRRKLMFREIKTIT